jgi:hypothetical protein
MIAGGGTRLVLNAAMRLISYRNLSFEEDLFAISFDTQV